jgi:hypothetical protein
MSQISNTNVVVFTLYAAFSELCLQIYHKNCNVAFRTHTAFVFPHFVGVGFYESTLMRRYIFKFPLILRGFT